MLIGHAPIASKEAANLHVVHFITTERIVITFAATAASSSAISKPGQCVYLDASLSALNCSMALLGFACASQRAPAISLWSTVARGLRRHKRSSRRCAQVLRGYVAPWSGESNVPYTTFVNHYIIPLHKIKIPSYTSLIPVNSKHCPPPLSIYFYITIYHVSPTDPQSRRHDLV